MWGAICALLGGMGQSRLMEPPAFVRDLPDTLLEFVQANPFLLDKRPLEFSQHAYLKDVYAAFDLGRARKQGRLDVVLQTAAQVGKSGAALTATTFTALKRWGRNVGYFLPDRELADIFSSNRFYPLIISNPTVGAMLGAPPSLVGREAKADDRKRVRTLGESTVYFSYMGGKTSTEAIPMDALFFDEVRRMTMGEIELASERVSHADVPLIFKLSTAGFPDCDINAYFKQSTMHVWHSRCGCREGVSLAHTFPDSVGVRGVEVWWRCPRCDRRIEHPGDGWYVPRQPESRVSGFHVSQIVSPVKTAAGIWQKYLEATDRKEFYNSTLGLPWVDPDNILVPESVALTCVDESVPWQHKGTNCLMGVDQRGGENHAVILTVRDDGKLQMAHVEIVQGDDPFARLYELMARFDVDVCVIDALPSYNEAVKFAKRFKRRVFLAYYTDNAHMIRWSDRDGELKALWGARPDAKFEFHVFLDRYKAIEYALMQWVTRRVVCPHPRGLVQTVKVMGVPMQSHVCLGSPDTKEQGLFYHLRSVARHKLAVARRDSKTGETVETGEFRMVWENIGIDPHFAHAWTYAVMAATRRVGGTALIVPQGALPPTVEALQATRPDLSVRDAADLTQMQTRLAMPVAPEPITATCGICTHFSAALKLCQAKRMGTEAGYPACEDQYDPKEDDA